MVFMFDCIAEEEASKFRFYMDEPAYTDLHWVGLFTVLITFPCIVV